MEYPHCTHDAAESGPCRALAYFDPSDPFDTYIGSTRREAWRPGPIDIEWDDCYDAWLWRYPGEDREPPGGRIGSARTLLPFWA